MDIILRPFAWLLLLFYNVVQNYGVALILFALLVKVILFPLSLKGKKSMIQMNLLSGQMQKLQKQYGKDQARYNQEVQKLYEREHVSPMGGCLWSFIPLFILIPLYSVIRQPLKYMMNFGKDQILSVANALNWDTVAVARGWATEKAVADALAKSQELVQAGEAAIASGFVDNGYNQLFLASMITEKNLSSAQAAAAAVGEGGKALAMNFGLFGLDLSQIPKLKFWEGGLNWGSAGLFLLVIISALTGLVFSRIMQKTNNINQGAQNEQAAKTNRMMMWMTPLMSLWIGFVMPGLLCVYWIAQNVFSLGQEIICGKILKKDYEAAAQARAEMEQREKEEEKERKRKAAERRALEAEEAKKNKKKAPKKGDGKDTSAAGASRVGIRAYARGRAYDPERFGGVTPYRDPSAPVDEAAIEAALMAREEAGSAPEEEAAPQVPETAAGGVEAVAEEAAQAAAEEAAQAAREEPAAEDGPEADEDKE